MDIEEISFLFLKQAETRILHLCKQEHKLVLISRECTLSLLLLTFAQEQGVGQAAGTVGWQLWIRAGHCKPFL